MNGNPSQDPDTSHGGTRRIAVLGAGITGLTAAWHLKQAGLFPTIFEQSPRVGGAIGTVHSHGWLHELGPNSVLDGPAEVAALVEGLGLAGRRLYASAAAKRRRASSTFMRDSSAH